jgi:predicted nucleic acid-binding protein
VEAANALGKRVRLSALSEEGVRSAWRELLETPLIVVAVEPELIEDALELGLRLRHPVQDCLYLALALHREARVLTADRKFGEAAHRSAELRDKVLLLKA